METWVWVVIGVVVVFLVLGALGRSQGATRLDPTHMTFDPDLMARVRELSVNQKIAAIRLLRDGAPGLGLADAKNMVERLARSSPPPTSPPPDLLQGYAAQSPSESAVRLEVELEARSLVAAGKKIHAIKVVREETGWSLLDAKEYVDTL
ncbi:hypothetical protein EH165_15065 [Nakamurella antarctica]|uniref:Ribosomal protein L7/L12 C-terminal domain-containing protein n=1 Tax=Nakamurella antarctica TaxID=1902245 RepID=A0A3G9A0E9_9ACTN|nr:hypothetical protein [Nakamurella antarctica]AZI59261.1 hypothetical protein EH165_15065 [Nakamurella antarctica]